MDFLRPLLLSLLAVVYLFGEVYAKGFPSFPFAGNASQQEKRRDDRNVLTSDQQSVKAIYRDQAIQVLSDALNSSNSIDDLGQRSLLVSRAADLLWPYDPELAGRKLSATLEYFLDQYKEPAVKNSSQKLGRLNAAVNRLLKVLARKDPTLAESESKIKYLDDHDIRERLVDLLEYHAAKASLKDFDLIELTRRSNQIADPRIRLMLLLESAKATSERNIANQFLLDARSLILKISSKTDRAKGLIAVASLSATTHPQLSQEVLTETVKAINAADDFDGGEFQVEVAIMSNFRVILSIPDSDLDTCLKRVAKIDWRNTLNLTEDLNSKTLKALARISICAAVL